jgi:sarcosine oxidase subunit alpha
MAARRLARPLYPDAEGGRPVTVRWDGRDLDGRAGEPLAATLLANGEATISRSYRLHRPRGLMCATGSCGWCECEVDGLASVRSCRVPVREGLEARSEHAWPSVGRDVFGILDRAHRLITPGFYHHRFLRPVRLRKTYLEVIRWFGGRGRVRPGPRPAQTGTHAERAIEADVVVVGSGRAGLTAALAALGAGARVVVIETEVEPGGSARWTTETGVVGADPWDARTLVAEARRLLGPDLLTGGTAVAREGETLWVVESKGLLAVRAPIVIAATGSYERPPLVPGGERPSVMGARLVEQLIERWGILPGERAALVGEDGETARVARVLERAGATVVARIPEGSLTGIDGRDRAAGVRWTEAGSPRSAMIDLVVVGRRVPSLDLPLLAGARVAWRGPTLVPVLDELGRTTAPWLHVVGSASGLDLGGAEERGHAEVVGRAAATAALHPGLGAPGDATPRRVEAAPVMPASLAPAGAHVCYCEDVRVGDIARERAAGYDEPESLKRRTGALTGPCQGKLCLDRFLGACAGGEGAPAVDLAKATGSNGAAFNLPTTRPPLRPIRLVDLALVAPPPTAPTEGHA